MKNKETVDVAYWKWKFSEYLKKSNKATYIILSAEGKLEDLLTERAAEADREYTQSLESGASYQGAAELANAALLSGYSFSREEHIETILINHFPKEYEILNVDRTPHVIHEICLQVNSVYNQFTTQTQISMDDIEEAVVPHIAQFIFKYRTKYFS